MEFLKNIEWTPLNILKGLGLLLGALIVISLASRTLGPVTGVMMQRDGDYSMGTPSISPTESWQMRAVQDSDDGASYAEEAAYSGGMGNVKLSTNNISMPSPNPGGSVGGEAEDYEVTRYTATIETRNSDYACGEVHALKDLAHVVFENSNEYDEGCSYTFKVEHEKAGEVLAILENLNPKHLSENTYTIKKQLDDFTSETEILETKLATINETLENAVTAYDEITTLATRTEDAESLAKVIDSKINTLERLTQQRINISAQLERLSRAKAEQLDKLVYTYFSVDIYENKFVDGDSIKESWKSAVKGFVRDVNGTIQDMTINLVAFCFMVIQYVLYFFLLLYLVKFLWRAAVIIWKK